MTVAEEAVVTNAMEPVGQYMNQEATGELLGRKGHRLPGPSTPSRLSDFSGRYDRNENALTNRMSRSAGRVSQVKAPDR
jgi:hypothetical protein